MVASFSTRRSPAGAALAVFLLLPWFACAGSANPPPNTCELISGLAFPAAVAVAPDGRIFYNEFLSGSVRVMRLSGGAPVVDPTPFVTVPDLEQSNEGGLLGLALDPEWNTTPWLYLYYTTSPSGFLENKIVRYWAANATAGGSEVILAGIPGGIFHNGGIMRFGPDGKLYVAVGDASAEWFVQNNTTLHGKVLRLEKNGTVPSDNPDPASPMFTVGHRSIFGLAFNPWTGVPYITENGPDHDDEVNLLVAGGNYGWPDALGVTNNSSLVDPLWNITPTTAPTGLVFDTTRFPNASSVDLYFGEFNTGNVWRLTLEGPTYDRVVDAGRFLWAGDRILALERLPDGRILVATLGGFLTFDPGRTSYEPPQAVINATDTATTDMQPVTFNGSGSLDPDGDGISRVLWEFGDGNTSTVLETNHTYASPGNYTVTFWVDDHCGYTGVRSKTVTILPPVRDNPPVAVLVPSASSLYEGQFANFSAAGSFDPEGARITGWQWDFGDGETEQGQPTAMHHYARAGNYRVVLTITDETNGTGTTEGSVLVAPPPPPPEAVITSNDPWVEAGEAVEFNATSSHSSAGAIVRATWDFGDGEAMEGLVVVHSFAVQGTYYANLTVTDIYGASNTTAFVVNVHEAEAPAEVPTVSGLVGIVALLASVALVFGAALRRPPGPRKSGEP